MPHDSGGNPCTMPCCMDDLRLESPKRSFCLPLFGLSRNSDRYQDHRRLLWNRPLLSRNFSFPRLGTRQVERKAATANSDKMVDKDLELVSCGIKPPKTKGQCQTLHFDFSRNENQDDEDQNKSSETLLEDMANLNQQEPNTFRRSRSTFMPIPLTAETMFNKDSSESEAKLSCELPPIPCSPTRYRTSPLARRCSGKTIITAPASYETKSPLSSLYTSPNCIYQTNYPTNSLIYSSKYNSQVEPYYATVQKPRPSVVSPVSSLQSSTTQFGSNSSVTSFSSPLVQRKSQPNLTSSTLSYSTTTTTSILSSENKTYESKYMSNPPTLSIYGGSTAPHVTTARDTETKYADVTSLMTSKYPTTGNSAVPIRAQFNRLASQVASKKLSKSILKSQYCDSQSSIETQSSTTHFPVYESIDDMKYIDDTASESSFLMEPRVIRQESLGRSKLANPTQNNNSTNNNKNAVSLVL